MRLYNFPCIVQKEILQHMNLSELITSTECSKNHNSYIQSMLKNELPKIRTICYHHKTPSSCKIATNGNKEFLVMKPIEKFKEGNAVEGYVFGQRLKCHQTEPDTIYCDSLNGPVVLRAIHQRIYNFFGNTVVYEVRTDISRYLPKLPHITSSVLKMKSAKDLRKYLEVSPNHSFLSVRNCAWTLEQIRVSPNTEVLQIWGYLGQRKALEQFNGKHLQITLGGLQNEDIIRFLNRWKSGEHYGNLEYLKTKLDQYDFDFIMRKAEIQRFEEEFQPPVHPLLIKEAKRSSADIDFRPINFSSHNFIVRETDGHVAYVRVIWNKVEFAVWNMTLEQLREYRPQS